MSPDLLKYLIEQAIEEELEEANALGMGGVVGNATLAAGQKPDHSILWSGDEPIKEQLEPSSLQDMLQAALANVAGSSISLDQLIKLGKVPEEPYRRWPKLVKFHIRFRLFAMVKSCGQASGNSTKSFLP
jgi:hypothetical protein